MTDDPPAHNTDPAIRVMMMPRDTNAHGTIFGGVILSYLDQAGAIEARKHGCDSVVTVAFDSVEFKQPVYVGDVLSFYASTLRTGRTSIRVQVDAVADRFQSPRDRVAVTAAEIVYVAVDASRRPVQVGRPGADR